MQIEVSHLVKEYKRKKNPENMLAGSRPDVPAKV